MAKTNFLTEDQFSQRIGDLWASQELGDDYSDELDEQVMLQVAFFIGGNIKESHTFDIDDHQVVAGIICNNDKFITSDQLCSIFDEGNHCISKGSIIYEDGNAYVLWSNKGHI